MMPEEALVAKSAQMHKFYLYLLSIQEEKMEGVCRRQEKRVLFKKQTNQPWASYTLNLTGGAFKNID